MGRGASEVTMIDEQLTNEELLELLAYHESAVENACSGGSVTWKSHSLMDCHGKEFHRLARIAESRGIYQRPTH
jgi:arsenate reductase-like glutaredoxin family protein